MMHVSMHVIERGRVKLWEMGIIWTCPPVHIEYLTFPRLTAVILLSTVAYCTATII